MMKGKSIILRTVREADLDEMICLNSDVQEKGEYWPLSIPSEPGFKKRFCESGLWENDTGAMLITAHDGQLLGEIWFFRGWWYQEGYEIGYQLYRSEDRRKGYMTEALRLFSAYLFAAKPIPRLQVNVNAGNLASRRVAEKCGFLHDGTMRKAVFQRGRYVDLALYSLLREESPTLDEVLGE